MNAMKNINKKAKKTDSPNLAEALTEAHNKCAEYLAGWQRCQADYQNLQKETQERITSAIKFGTEDLILVLSTLVDHFNYAFAGIPEKEKDSNWLKGIQHIQTNFLKILTEQGVEIIKTVGETFDHKLHEAVEEVAGKEKGESGKIIEEVAAGFK